MHPLSLLYMVVDDNNRAKTGGRASPVASARSRVNLTRPSYLSPNNDHASASTRYVFALPR